MAKGGNVLKVDIADNEGFARWSGEAVDADVDHDGAWLDHIAGDEFGLADSGNEDISALADLLEVFGHAVSNCDSGIAMRCFLHQNGGQRLADDVAAADDHDVFAEKGNLRMGEENLDAVRGAGEKARWIADEHFPNIDRVKPIDIFLRGDALHGCDG